MSKIIEREKGIIALIFVSLFFASMGIFARYLQFDFTILQQTYLRVIAAFFLSIIFFYKDLHFQKFIQLSYREWVLLLFRAITWYVIGVTFLSQAFITTVYSNVAFIESLPLTAFFGFLLLREKITFRKLIYVAIGFLGVVVIAVKDYSHLFTWGHGELFALVSTIAFAINYVSRKWQGETLNNKEIAIGMFFISGILLVATSFFFHESLPRIESFSPFIGIILILAGAFNVMNVVLINFGFQKVEAVIAGNILMLEVLFALAIGFLFFGEIPQVKDIAGGILILFSAYMINTLS
ncbi:MAG TPA: DMT family transporter [Candidatus Eisenbacteria bacterium]|nr:DMT family transporter [Candidatus Eisenbacteria bacterium]